MNALVDVMPLVMQAMTEIAKGLKTKTRACDDVGITTTQYERYVNMSPDLRAMADEAEQRGRDSMAERLVDVGGGLLPSDPKLAGVISKNVQWLLSKQDRRKFGDHVQLDVNLTVDAVVVTALARAKERAIAHAGSQIVDAEYVVIEPPANMPPPPIAKPAVAPVVMPPPPIVKR